MRENNSHDSEIEKRKEEIIGALISRLVIMPFGPFKMSFTRAKTETEEVNDEKKKVDETDEFEIVGEKKSVEEDQAKVPPKENSTAEEIFLTLLDKDGNKELIDCIEKKDFVPADEEKEIVDNKPDSEEVDFVGKESKVKIEIEPKRGVVKNKPSEKPVDIIHTFQEKEAESEFETKTEIPTDEPGLEVFSSINKKKCEVGSAKYSRKHGRSHRDSSLAMTHRSNKY